MRLDLEKKYLLSMQEYLIQLQETAILFTQRTRRRITVTLLYPDKIRNAVNS